MVLSQFLSNPATDTALPINGTNIFPFSVRQRAAIAYFLGTIPTRCFGTFVFVCLAPSTRFFKSLFNTSVVTSAGILAFLFCMLGVIFSPLLPRLVTVGTSIFSAFCIPLIFYFLISSLMVFFIAFRIGFSPFPGTLTGFFSVGRIILAMFLALLFQVSIIVLLAPSDFAVSVPSIPLASQFQSAVFMLFVPFVLILFNFLAVLFSPLLLILSVIFPPCFFVHNNATPNKIAPSWVAVVNARSRSHPIRGNIRAQIKTRNSRQREQYSTKLEKVNGGELYLPNWSPSLLESC